MTMPCMAVNYRLMVRWDHKKNLPVVRIRFRYIMAQHSSGTIDVSYFWVNTRIRRNQIASLYISRLAGLLANWILVFQIFTDRFLWFINGLERPKRFGRCSLCFAVVRLIAQSQQIRLCGPSSRSSTFDVLRMYRFTDWFFYDLIFRTSCIRKLLI